MSLWQIGASFPIVWLLERVDALESLDGMGKALGYTGILVGLVVLGILSK